MYPNPNVFFKKYFVINYCPLLFLHAEGKRCRNLTPDKLSHAQSRELFRLCDQHLRETVAALQPDWVIGVGRFAEERIREALDAESINVGRILHPSPASPLANKNWAGQAHGQLQTMGIEL